MESSSRPGLPTRSTNTPSTSTRARSSPRYRCPIRSGCRSGASSGASSSTSLPRRSCALVLVLLAGCGGGGDDERQAAWELAPSMANRRSYVAAGEIAGRIYVAGGMVGNTGRRLEVPRSRRNDARRGRAPGVRVRRRGETLGSGPAASPRSLQPLGGNAGRACVRARWVRHRGRGAAFRLRARAWALAAIDRAPASGARVRRRGLPGRDLGDRRPPGCGAARRGVDLQPACGSLARWPEAAEADGATRCDGRRGRDSRRLGAHVPDLRRLNRPLAGRSAADRAPPRALAVRGRRVALRSRRLYTEAQRHGGRRAPRRVLNGHDECLALALSLEAEVLGDDHPLHLVRALADFEDLLVTVEARDRVLVHEAVAAVDLERRVRRTV